MSCNFTTFPHSPEYESLRQAVQGAAIVLEPVATLCREGRNDVLYLPSRMLTDVLARVSHLGALVTSASGFPCRLKTAAILYYERAFVHDVLLPAYIWLLRSASSGRYQQLLFEVGSIVEKLLLPDPTYRDWPSHITDAISGLQAALASALLRADTLQVWALTLAARRDALKDRSDTRHLCDRAYEAADTLVSAVRLAAVLSRNSLLELFDQSLAASCFLEHACTLRLSLAECVGQILRDDEGQWARQEQLKNAVAAWGTMLDFGGLASLQPCDVNLIHLVGDCCHWRLHHYTLTPSGLVVSDTGLEQMSDRCATCWPALSHPAVQLYLGWWLVATPVVTGASVSARGLPDALLAGCPLARWHADHAAKRHGVVHYAVLAAARCWLHELTSRRQPLQPPQHPAAQAAAAQGAAAVATVPPAADPDGSAGPAACAVTRDSISGPMGASASSSSDAGLRTGGLASDTAAAVSVHASAPAATNLPYSPLHMYEMLLSVVEFNWPGLGPEACTSPRPDREYYVQTREVWDALMECLRCMRPAPAARRLGTVWRMLLRAMPASGRADDGITGYMCYDACRAGKLLGLLHLQPPTERPPAGPGAAPAPAAATAVAAGAVSGRGEAAAGSAPGASPAGVPGALAAMATDAVGASSGADGAAGACPARGEEPVQVASAAEPSCGDVADGCSPSRFAGQLDGGGPSSSGGTAASRGGNRAVTLGDETGEGCGERLPTAPGAPDDALEHAPLQQPAASQPPLAQPPSQNQTATQQQQQQLLPQPAHTVACALSCGLLPALEQRARDARHTFLQRGVGPSKPSSLCSLVDLALRRPGCWPALAAHGEERQVGELVVTLGRIARPVGSVQPPYYNRNGQVDAYPYDAHSAYRLQLLALLEQTAAALLDPSPAVAQQPHVVAAQQQRCSASGGGEEPGEGPAGVSALTDTRTAADEPLRHPSPCQPGGTAGALLHSLFLNRTLSAAGEEGKEPGSSHGTGGDCTTSAAGSSTSSGCTPLSGKDGFLPPGPSWDQVVRAGGSPAAASPARAQLERMAVMMAAEWLPPLLTVVQMLGCTRRRVATLRLTTEARRLSELLPHRSYLVAWQWLLLLARQCLAAHREGSAGGELLEDTSGQVETSTSPCSGPSPWCHLLLEELQVLEHIRAVLFLACVRQFGGKCDRRVRRLPQAAAAVAAAAAAEAAAAAAAAMLGADVCGDYALEGSNDAAISAALEVLPCALDVLEVLMEAAPEAVAQALKLNARTRHAVNVQVERYRVVAGSAIEEATGAGVAAFWSRRTAWGPGLPYDWAVVELLEGQGRRGLGQRLAELAAAAGLAAALCDLASDDSAVGSSSPEAAPTGLLWREAIPVLPTEPLSRGWLVPRCAFSGCSQQPGPVPQLKACSRCLAVSYCSRECQQADWAGAHKARCAKAATGGAGRSSNSNGSQTCGGTNSNPLGNAADGGTEAGGSTKAGGGTEASGGPAATGGTEAGSSGMAGGGTEAGGGTAAGGGTEAGGGSVSVATANTAAAGSDRNGQNGCMGLEAGVRGGVPLMGDASPRLWRLLLRLVSLNLTTPEVDVGQAEGLRVRLRSGDEAALLLACMPGGCMQRGGTLVFQPVVHGQPTHGSVTPGPAGKAAKPAVQGLAAEAAREADASFDAIIYRAHAFPRRNQPGYDWQEITPRLHTMTARSRLNAQVKSVREGMVKRRLGFIWLRGQGVEGVRRVLHTVAQLRSEMLAAGRDLCVAPISVTGPDDSPVHQADEGQQSPHPSALGHGIRQLNEMFSRAANQQQPSPNSYSASKGQAAAEAEEEDAPDPGEQEAVGELQGLLSLLKGHQGFVVEVVILECAPGKPAAFIAPKAEEEEQLPERQRRAAERKRKEKQLMDVMFN